VSALPFILRLCLEQESFCRSSSHLNLILCRNSTWPKRARVPAIFNATRFCFVSSLQSVGAIPFIRLWSQLVTLNILGPVRPFIRYITKLSNLQNLCISAAVLKQLPKVLLFWEHACLCFIRVSHPLRLGKLGCIERKAKTTGDMEREVIIVIESEANHLSLSYRLFLFRSIEKHHGNTERTQRIAFFHISPNSSL